MAGERDIPSPEKSETVVLSGAQKKVVAALFFSLGNNDIAKVLGWTRSAVESQIFSVGEKLNVSGKSDIYSAAEKLDLVDEAEVLSFEERARELGVLPPIVKDVED